MLNICPEWMNGHHLKIYLDFSFFCPANLYFSSVCISSCVYLSRFLNQWFSNFWASGPSRGLVKPQILGPHLQSFSCTRSGEALRKEPNWFWCCLVWGHPLRITASSTSSTVTSKFHSFPTKGQRFLLLTTFRTASGLLLWDFITLLTGSSQLLLGSFSPVLSSLGRKNACMCFLFR